MYFGLVGILLRLVVVSLHRYQLGVVVLCMLVNWLLCRGVLLWRLLYLVRCLVRVALLFVGLLVVGRRVVFV